MLTYCLLATLLVGVTFADPPKVTCNGITPLKDIDVDSVSGNWVAVESVAFNNGVAFNPVNVDDDKRTHTCIHTEVGQITSTGFTAKLRAHVPGKDPITETNTLTFIGDEKGRLSMHSDIQNRENWEFVVLDASASKYLVYVLCQPPNADGERLPERVNLMSRHADHADHASLTAAELTDLETQVAQKLGINGHNIKPVKYCTTCWTGYPVA